MAESSKGRSRGPGLDARGEIATVSRRGKVPKS
jgi:hypothetical protein